MEWISEGLCSVGLGVSELDSAEFSSAGLGFVGLKSSGFDSAGLSSYTLCYVSIFSFFS